MGAIGVAVPGRPDGSAVRRRCRWEDVGWLRRHPGSTRERRVVLGTLVLGVLVLVSAPTWLPAGDPSDGLNRSTTDVPDFVEHSRPGVFEVHGIDGCTNLLGHVDAAGIRWSYQGDLRVPASLTGRERVSGILHLEGADALFVTDAGLRLRLTAKIPEPHCGIN